MHKTNLMLTLQSVVWPKMSILVLMVAICAGVALAQTTTFTYQGRLTDVGVAATGQYDLEFKLFDAAGAQVGPRLTREDVAVTNGIFTVSLDFGAGAFDGNERTLEIGVRQGASTDAFTALAPRQAVTSTPYAIRSLTAANATNATNAQQLGGTAASQYVRTDDGRLTDARTPLAGSSNYVQNTTTPQAGVSFNVAGNGTVGGTLSGNVVNTATQYNIGGSRVLGVVGTNSTNTYTGIGAGATNGGSNNSFFGRSAGLNTTGGSNSFFGTFAGVFNTTGFNNSFFGFQAGRFNTTGAENAFFGTLAGEANTTGNSNAFFGSRAGEANTTGLDNAFFGKSAGNVNVNGNSNSFFGTSAGVSNTSGANNSFFGRSAGFSNTTGGSNTFFGLNAGLANTTGSNNTIIGSGANVGSGDLTNATAIGSGAIVSQSNSLVLGNAVNVGIGTSAPTFKLHVLEPSINGLRVQTSTAGGAVASFSGLGAFQVDAPNVVGGRLIILENGRVGINTTTPDQLLSVNGNASKFGGGSWLVYSDERLKKIRGRFTTGLSAVMQLQPVRYEYMTQNAMGINSSGEHIGFGAQAVQKIIPEAVVTNSKGYLLVNNDAIMWTMLNAVKEQQTQIEQQRNQIEQQQNLLKQQQLQLESMKRLICQDHPNAAVCQ
jgi:hypothetical protein